MFNGINESRMFRLCVFIREDTTGHHCASYHIMTPEVMSLLVTVILRHGTLYSTDSILYYRPEPCISILRTVSFTGIVGKIEWSRVRPVPSEILNQIFLGSILALNYNCSLNKALLPLFVQH